MGWKNWVTPYELAPGFVLELLKYMTLRRNKYLGCFDTR